MVARRPAHHRGCESSLGSSGAQCHGRFRQKDYPRRVLRAGGGTVGVELFEGGKGRFWRLFQCCRSERQNGHPCLRTGPRNQSNGAGKRRQRKDRNTFLFRRGNESAIRGFAAYEVLNRRWKVLISCLQLRKQG